jgi:hypothetical protein
MPRVGTVIPSRTTASAFCDASNGPATVFDVQLTAIAVGGIHTS